VAGVKVCPSPLTLIVALTTLSHYRATTVRVCELCVYFLPFASYRELFVEIGRF